MDLIERLTAIQREMGASDKQFGERLGLSDAAWTNIRNGKREMGRKALRGVRKAFPELAQAIYDYATSEPVEAA